VAGKKQHLAGFHGEIHGPERFEPARVALADLTERYDRHAAGLAEQGRDELAREIGRQFEHGPRGKRVGKKPL
jgi:hypothetical protein